MKKEEIYEKLNKIFREIFDDETINVTAGTTSNDIEDWDSLEHINLVVAIEEVFHIKFSIDEVQKFKNVGDMAEMIMDKGII